MCGECTSPVSHGHHSMMQHKDQILKPLFKGRPQTCTGITRKLPLQEQAPFVHLTKLLAQLDKVSSHQELLTRPTSLWVNLQLINWGLSLCCDCISSRLLHVFSNLKQQIQIIRNSHYIHKHYECTNVTSLGTSEACEVIWDSAVLHWIWIVKSIPQLPSKLGWVY